MTGSTKYQFTSSVQMTEDVYKNPEVLLLKLQPVYPNWGMSLMYGSVLHHWR